MQTPLAPKRMRDSRIQLAQIMNPENANPHGNVHGGWIMKLVDEAGGLAATRHTGRRVVTVVMDRMTFRQPIHVGDLVILEAEVTFAGHTSVEVEVQVVAEDPITGRRTHTNTAYLVFVAIDEHEHPVPVPGLITENPAEKARMEAGRKRQEQRLQEKSAENR